MELALFYLFAVVAVLASLGVIGQGNPMHSVLLLIVSFAALAGLYIGLDSPFAAVTQIIVYAGAIMVLFLFVIMLLNLQIEDPDRGRRRVMLRALAWGGGAILAIELAMLIHGTPAGTSAGAAPTGYGSAEAVAKSLFTDFLLPFELTSILLLVAVVGAVVLAQKQRRPTIS
jgi:NADH-quinone oxidoreductase subunit J